MADPKPTKPKATLTPEQEALRRATAAYEAGSGDYSKSLLASGSIRDAIARAVADSDPTLDQLRTSKADIDKRLGTVYADSLDDLQGVTDPRVREQIRSRRSSEFGAEAAKLGGLVSDRRGSQDQTVDRFAGVYNAQTQAKGFDVDQKRTALDRAIQAENSSQARAFDSRFDDLTRREKEASIAAANRSNRGGGGGGGSTFSFEDAMKNPLGAFLFAGGKRTQDESGGYQFTGPDGKPITVDQAASMVPGGTRSDFLSGSRNAADAEYSGQKPLSDAANKTIASAQSGIKALDTLDKFVGSRGTRGLALLPGGLFNPQAQQYQNSSREVADVITRLRTGAAINESEERFYRKYIPGASDTPESAKQKLKTLRDLFTQLSESRYSSNAGADAVVDTGV